MKRTHQDGCPEFQRLHALDRREFLRVGGLGVLGLSLPHVLAAEANASNYGGERPKARAKACILVFLGGGPSQLETFDPKPDAPSDYKTIFGTIPTSVPGTFLCEHLPDLAKQAHRFALVRSAWHKFNGHFGGHRYALSGFAAPGGPDQPARPDDRPGLISLAAKYVPPKGSTPSAIMVPWPTTDQGSGASGGMGAGILSKEYDPVKVEIDQTTLDKPGKMPVFRVPAFALHPDLNLERFAGRRHLLGEIESQRQTLVAGAAEHDSLYQRACDMLTSPKIKEGFDIEKEDPKLRQTYGINALGQSCLLARRLVERGARFVQVNMARYVTMPGYGWDTHDKGEQVLKTQLLPKLNSAVGSLIADLADRGMLDDTLVVAMGEFGRTPKVKKDGGRDHWSNCYSFLMAGGGVRGGMVYGKSDKVAGYPAQDPVEAREIILTILTLLGVPTFTTDNLGRAAPLFEGADPIERLYS
jgi:uncharacterized protein (DUF1501 family)